MEKADENNISGMGIYFCNLNQPFAKLAKNISDFLEEYFGKIKTPILPKDQLDIESLTLNFAQEKLLQDFIEILRYKIGKIIIIYLFL